MLTKQYSKNYSIIIPFRYQYLTSLAVRSGYGNEKEQWNVYNYKHNFNLKKKYFRLELRLPRLNNRLLFLFFFLP